MRTIKVYCQNCNVLLYKYHKQSSGHLVKCYKERIIKNYNRDGLRCSQCGKEFARETIVDGRPVYKIIQGRIFIKS